ncbi:hypothetical protein OMW55_04765 [Sphingomonas sp. BN140010]|uniref:Serine kinase n=1 Tax=Sphingomonas arvum TaxID=2992113 RepID=A0ABT3JDH4_9SPHN|nr:hypothetical protein [Sphingomonas sp. BN140010]MCW3797118.1 hypothetical protein [Sphingomonas sp. BN140010]
MASQVMLPDSARAILQPLGSRNLLFVESDQALYEVDDPAAWRAAATFEPHRGAGQDATALLTSLTMAVAEVPIHLHLPSPLLASVVRLLGHLRSAAPASATQLSVRLSGDRAILAQAGRPEWTCPADQAVPALKAMLVESVLSCARHDLALHAAALVERGRLALLLGSPGAGKSSMALALAQAGLALAADDVALLDATGRVTGLPFPHTAKASSWLLLAQRFPELALGTPFMRPDGQRVRYILPPRFAPSVPTPVGAVVVLDRRASGAASVQEVDPLDALSELLADAAGRDDRLTNRAFVGLTAAVRRARCLRLTYADLIEGRDLLLTQLP